MNDFLPADYKVPTDSKYMKFQQGSNRFRILGSFANQTAIMGYEYWKSGEEGKRTPVRVMMGVNIPMTDLEESEQTGELDMPKHFWAFPVYNWNEERVQILEITQKSVMNGIKDLARNKSWGDPAEYDLVVTQTGQQLKTKYSVVPNPKEKLPPEVQVKVKATPVNIVALFSGEDPFKTPATENVEPEEIESGMEKARKAAEATKK